MSRHKLVKALDLDEELDDFDGGVDSDFEEEVSAEDKGLSSPVECLASSSVCCSSLN